uniref:Uncharacterized protein n=1 Tax=Anopheles quadriannulatus TaxID=34691 RepID=A0A182XQB8_ANOQN
MHQSHAFRTWLHRSTCGKVSVCFGIVCKRKTVLLKIH